MSMNKIGIQKKWYVIYAFLISVNILQAYYHTSWTRVIFVVLSFITALAIGIWIGQEWKWTQKNTLRKYGS